MHGCLLNLTTEQDVEIEYSVYLSHAEMGWVPASITTGCFISGRALVRLMVRSPEILKLIVCGPVPGGWALTSSIAARSVHGVLSTMIPPPPKLPPHLPSPGCRSPLSPADVTVKVAALAEPATTSTIKTDRKAHSNAASRVRIRNPLVMTI